MAFRNVRFGRGSVHSRLVRSRFAGRMIVRPGAGIVVAGRRGGFFKKLFKGVKKVVSAVGKVPVVGTIAKAAVSQIPLVKAVNTAVSVVKKASAAGASTRTPPMSQSTTGPDYGGAKEARSQGLGRYAKKRRAPKRAAKPAKRRKAAKRRAGGSAKQRAARARFAAAARKGRIKKGSRL